MTSGLCVLMPNGFLTIGIFPTMMERVRKRVVYTLELNRVGYGA